MSDKMDSGITTAIVSATAGVMLKWLLDRIRSARRPRPLSVKEMQYLLERMDRCEDTSADMIREFRELRGTVDGFAEKLNRWNASHGD